MESHSSQAMTDTAHLPLLPGDFEPDDLPTLPHRAMFDLWSSKRQNGRLPRRCDFDPCEIPHLLPHITIFDVVRNPMRFRIRLVGTAIVDAMGFDTTGQWLDELDNIRDVHRRAEAVAYTGTPYFLRAMPLAWTHPKYKRYSVLGLPLAIDGEKVDKLLYTMHFDQGSPP